MRKFEAYNKGDRSLRLHSQLVELQQELDAFMPNELPLFLKRPKHHKPAVRKNEAKGNGFYQLAATHSIIPSSQFNILAFGCRHSRLLKGGEA